MVLAKDSQVRARATAERAAVLVDVADLHQQHKVRRRGRGKARPRRGGVKNDGATRSGTDPSVGIGRHGSVAAHPPTGRATTAWRSRRRLHGRRAQTPSRKVAGCHAVHREGERAMV